MICFLYFNRLYIFDPIRKAIIFSAICIRPSSFIAAAPLGLLVKTVHTFKEISQIYLFSEYTEGTLYDTIESER